ncbi:MAG: hypothetical protein EOP07_18585 [Proteobacteria bacterium]|nr:MAG: hypothetical protein EOP07_18585 [Pseudomonadota bacterium]
MKVVTKALLACGLTLALVSCGSSDDDEAAVVVSGSLKTSLLASTDIKSTTLTSASCANDVNTGLFTATFGGEGGTRLGVKIKGFTATGATYSCSQAADNPDGDVGSKYNICAVDFSVASSVSGVDTYSMYRDLPAAPAFSYGGTCTVVTTFEGSKVKLTVSCANLVRTYLQSREVFPVDQNVVGSVNGATTAECNI